MVRSAYAPVGDGIGGADTAGNHVIVQVGPDTWAFYAHLQPGSPTIAAGDEVTTGQLLGKVGNNGNSLAPHLHFGLQDAPHPAGANSLPFVLDRYTVADVVDRDSYLAAFSGTGPLELRPHSRPSPQTNTFPLNLDVIDFPG
jgi:murein DD-endopeptidase MepM/ murein hydrolase activator NlpD